MQLKTNILAWGPWGLVVASGLGLIGVAALDGRNPGLAQVEIGGGSTLAEPRIEVQPVVDVGEIPAGQSAKVKLQIANVGGTPLVIEEVRQSCSCTVPTTVPITVQPGTAEPLEIVYTSRITPEPYDINLRVELRTNDPRNKSLPVMLTGKCAPTIYWSQQRLFLGQVRRGTTKRSVLRIHERRPELLPRALGLSKVSFEGDKRFRFIDAKRWTAGAEKGLDLTFEFTAGDKDGKYNTVASIHLNVADQFVIPLPIVAEVSNSITADPSVLAWTKNQTTPVDVEINGVTKERASELKVNSSPPLLNWEIMPPRDAAGSPVIRFSKRTQEGASSDSRGTITVELAGEEGGSVKIPFIVVP